jgi:hypothetical protein
MYRYGELRESLFTDKGQRMLFKAKAFIDHSLTTAGAVRMGNVMPALAIGDSWMMMACVDRLVELGEIKEVLPVEYVRGQDRVFVRNMSSIGGAGNEEVEEV